jgi:hypothetical protein
LHLLPLALVLVGILSLPLLISGAILSIVPRVTTSETPIVIGLMVLLLLWLIVVSLNRQLGAVGCLLLLLWSDHPTSLLLRSPVLSGQIQSGSAGAELMSLSQGSSSSFLPNGR